MAKKTDAQETIHVTMPDGTVREMWPAEYETHLKAEADAEKAKAKAAKTEGN